MAEAEKTEKITVNLGIVDLGQIDLLVQEGFYAHSLPPSGSLRAGRSS